MTETHINLLKTQINLLKTKLYLFRTKINLCKIQIILRKTQNSDKFDKSMEDREENINEARRRSDQILKRLHHRFTADKKAR